MKSGTRLRVDDKVDLVTLQRGDSRSIRGSPQCSRPRVHSERTRKPQDGSSSQVTRARRPRDPGTDPLDLPRTWQGLIKEPGASPAHGGEADRQKCAGDQEVIATLGPGTEQTESPDIKVRRLQGPRPARDSLRDMAQIG